MKLSRYEQETIINYNAGEKTAWIYTRDPAVIRKLDTLVIEHPDTFKCVGETDIDKAYEMPKAAIIVSRESCRRLRKRRPENG